MRELKTLVGYEYKKIGKRRSAQIALAFLLAWALFSGFPMGNYYIEGEAAASHYAIVKQERAALEGMGGRMLDQAFFQEKSQKEAALKQSQEFKGTGKDGYLSKAYWQKYFEMCMPYQYVNQFYALLERNLGSIDTDHMDEQSFYRYHGEMLDAIYQTEGLSPGEIAVHKGEAAKVEQPYAYGNMLGFDKYFEQQGFCGLVIMIVIAVCLTPVFVSEYACHTDSLVLSSRFGKNKAIWAKLLAGFSFAILITILCLGILLLEIGMIYGFSGWNLPVQACKTGFITSLPLTMLQMLGISVGCAICASCMAAAVVMFCSARIRTGFGVIIVSILFICLPNILIYAVYKKRLWFMIVNSMPVCAMYPSGITDSRLFSVGSHYFYFFQAIPVAYLFFIAGFGAWAFYSFRRHSA